MWHIYVLSNRLTDQNNEIAVKSYLFFSGALIRKKYGIRTTKLTLFSQDKRFLMWHIYVYYLLSNRLTDQNNEIAVKSFDYDR